MVQDFAEALMGAEAEALCGASYGERSSERVNSAGREQAGGATPPRLGTGSVLDSSQNTALDVGWFLSWW
jgi:hypothetical protein